MGNRSWQYRPVARQAVKYRALLRLPWGRTLWILVFFAIEGLQMGQARAQRLSKPKQDGPSILLGGGAQPVKGPVLLDPVLPRGEIRATPLLFTKSGRCSLRRPVCVKARFSEEATVVSALSKLEAAYEEHRFGASLPPPHASFEEPLVWQIEAGTGLKVHDRGRATCLGGLLDMEHARRCVIGAALSSVAPATASWLRDGYAADSARRLGPAPQTSHELSTSFENPQLGVLTSSAESEHFRGGESVKVSRLRSARFFSYLEERSLDEMGSAGWLSLTLGATRTPAGASRWQAEPDITDVLLATVGGERTHLAQLFDDFAGFTFFQGESWGMPVEPAWTLPVNSLPRSVVIPSPLEPTGSVYLKVELGPGELGAIAFRMNCEAPVSYVWSVIRLDEQGRRISRVSVAYRQRGGQSATSIEPEQGTRALLLVGTNMGGVALSHPFDPDHEPHEAHGCSVAVNRISYDVAPSAGER
jgi:hypothetical protein